MPTVLVKDVLYRVGQLVNDVSPQFSAFTERELVNYLNDGQLSVCKVVPWASSRLDAIQLTAGQSRQSIANIPSSKMIPQDGSAPATVQGIFLADLVANMGAAGTTEGSAIRIVDRLTLNRNRPGWMSISGSEVLQFVFDPRYPKAFFVTPRPATAIWVLAAYQALPVTIPAGGAPGSEIYGFSGSSTQTITIDDRFTDDLANYVIARCYAKASEEGSVALYQSFMTMFAASLKTHVEAMAQMNPNMVKS